jgi:hypothetical protein
MTPWISFWSFQARLIIRARLGPSPSTSLRRPGSFSMTVRASFPNLSTMRRAMTGPIPLIIPEPR